MPKDSRSEKRFMTAFKEVRSYILQEGLQPGDLLPTEATLCEKLNFSRNVLREAIKSMEVMGMVKACPGRGTEICDFSLDFVFQNVMFSTVGADSRTTMELLDIRKKIELGFMRQAYFALTDADVVRIRRVFELIKQNWEEQIYHHADDRDFHLSLFVHLGNTTLMSLLKAIWAVDENINMDKQIRHADDTLEKHEHIIRALENRNIEAFEAAMLAHFSSGKYTRCGQSYHEY